MFWWISSWKIIKRKRCFVLIQENLFERFAGLCMVYSRPCWACAPALLRSRNPLPIYWSSMPYSCLVASNWTILIVKRLLVFRNVNLPIKCLWMKVTLKKTVESLHTVSLKTFLFCCTLLIILLIFTILFSITTGVWEWNVDNC